MAIANGNIKRYKQESQIEEWNYAATAGYLSRTEKDAIIDAYNNGEGWLSKEIYDEIVLHYRGTVNVSVSMYVQDGKYMSLEKANTELKKILNDPFASKTMKDEAQRIFNEQYVITGTDRTVSVDKWKDNGKIKVTITTGWGDNKKNEQYVLDEGKEVTDKHIKDIAKNLSGNKLFGYQGKVYIKSSDGTIYEVEQRGVHKGDYINVEGWITGKW